jgi:tungstate transport system ATP-binding protein
MAEALLELQEILVRYGGTAIIEVPSLSVYPGEVLAVIGPNGAGKSTLLRVMGALELPTAGKVFFQRSEVTRHNRLPVRRRMASVFQEPLLLNASVYENAALGLKLRGLDGRFTEQRVLPWLERLGIAHLAARPIRSLSGGEAQRTSLARALALDPELLLLDEPFSSLDPPTREGLLLDLETILRETGIATVFVTHDRDEAFMLGDRVAVLISGRIIEIGPKDEVFARPVDEVVADFVGIETKIPAVTETTDNGLTKVRFRGGSAKVAGRFTIGEPLLLCLRPDDIMVTLPEGADLNAGAENRLSASVAKITPWGSHYRVVLDCDGTRLVASVSRSSFVERGFRVGDCMVASFKATAVHVIKRK